MLIKISNVFKKSLNLLQCDMQMMPLAVQELSLKIQFASCLFFKIAMKLNSSMCVNSMNSKKKLREIRK